LRGRLPAGCRHAAVTSGWAAAPGCASHRRCKRCRVCWFGVCVTVCPQAAAMRLLRAVGRQPPAVLRTEVRALLSALVWRLRGRLPAGCRHAAVTSGWAAAPGCASHRRCKRCRGSSSVAVHGPYSCHKYDGLPVRRAASSPRGLHRSASLPPKKLSKAHSADQRAITRLEPSPWDRGTMEILEFRGVFGMSEERSWLEVFSSEKAGVRFDGAKREYGPGSRRFVIPASPSH